MNGLRLHCGARILDLARPAVMGVLNVTPDSFSDGGRHFEPHAAIAAAERMVAEGADIIDVGGESTRPGAAPIEESEELRRVLPVLERIASLPVVVSIDTSKPAVMREALAAGASMINDVRALTAPGALQVAAAGHPAAVCLMHMQGEPDTMQAAPRYGDVVTDIKAFLAARVQACLAQGIQAERIAVDPGFGFGKTLEHNLELMRRLREFTDLGLPLLVGLSRKSMLGKLLGRAVDERIAGGLALALLAVQRGARIVRTHDVAATVDALKVQAAIEPGES